jgi:AraC-like DNA-binding protein
LLFTSPICGFAVEISLMIEGLFPLHRIPKVVRISINQGPNVCGAFIDSEWVFHYVVEGRWVFELESRCYDISPGDMVLIPPWLLHVVRPVGGDKQVQWVVHFDLLNGPVPFGSFPYVVSSSAGDRRKIRLLFQMLNETTKRGNDTFHGSITAALIGVYKSCIDSVKAARPRVMPNWGALEQAIRHIQDHYRKKGLQLSEVSRSAGLTPHYLCRVFKQCFGVSAMHYLTTYRIQKAEGLLLNTALNCSEIAEAVGFESVHTLSKVFRKIKGSSPMNYRQSYRGGRL